MTAAAKEPEAPAPFKAGPPPGDAVWCATCARFAPGPMVVNGSTLGRCGAHRRVTMANGWCEQHRERDMNDEGA